MLAGEDKETLCSLRLLRDSARGSLKPLLLWIGAGVSAWSEYPLWGELADNIHSVFLKYESKYEAGRANALLSGKKFPSFFQLCKETSSQRYYSELVRNLGPRPVPPVYRRFIKTVEAQLPLFIVTTNVDEALECNLGMISTVQRTDLERCSDLLSKRTSFIAKLHGSISAVNSIVFTEEDYAHLTADMKYLETIKQIFTQSSVIFMGYGMADEYVLSLLARSADLKGIFGDGPHFVVTQSSEFSPPIKINVIRYKAAPHTDHRTAIQVLEVVNHVRGPGNEHPGTSLVKTSASALQSAHFISDIYPPGTYNSSYTIQLGPGPNGQPFSVITGQGWTDSEKPSPASTAMHDLVVGLLCFDVTYAPLTCANRIHDLLGSEFFWDLVKAGAMRFVYWESDEGIVYPTVDAIAGGMLGHIRTSSDKEGKIRTIGEVIRLQLHAAPGKESEAEKLFGELERNSLQIDSSTLAPVLEATKGLLILPHIRALLGLSDGTPIESLPRWAAFQVLRFANIVRVGMTCQLLRLVSTKLLFGCASLAIPALSAASTEYWADDAASYVLSGRFNTDLGTFVIQDASILRAVLAFRDTQSGVALRKDVFSRLSVNAGSDIVVAIDAGLRSALPAKILDQARNEMAGLFLTQAPVTGQITPAIWTDMKYTTEAIAQWRKRGLSEFLGYCETTHIGKYDPCPCGSGEKRRFCCEAALNS
jgi:SIR2-like domain